MAPCGPDSLSTRAVLIPRIPFSERPHAAERAALDSPLAQGFPANVRTFVLAGTQCMLVSFVMRICLPQTLAAARTTARGEISGKS